LQPPRRAITCSSAVALANEQQKGKITWNKATTIPRQQKERHTSHVCDRPAGVSALPDKKKLLFSANNGQDSQDVPLFCIFYHQLAAELKAFPERKRLKLPLLHKEGIVLVPEKEGEPACHFCTLPQPFLQLKL
jgi:hypothetical protein